MTNTLTNDKRRKDERKSKSLHSSPRDTTAGEEKTPTDGSCSAATPSCSPLSWGRKGRREEVGKEEEAWGGREGGGRGRGRRRWERRGSGEVGKEEEEE